MRTRFFAGAALVLLLWPQDARAGCALAPQVEFAPADGALPPGGVVYVFVHKSSLYARSQVDALRVERAGSAITSKQRALFKSERYDVIELALPKSTGEVRVIARVGDETFRARYTLAAQTRTPEVETRLVSARYQFRGGCPGSNGFAIAVEPRAAAYRVAWPDETAGAPPHRLIVPDGADANARYGELVIGSQGCDLFGIDGAQPVRPRGHAALHRWTRGRDVHARRLQVIRAGVSRGAAGRDRVQRLGDALRRSTVVVVRRADQRPLSPYCARPAKRSMSAMNVLGVIGFSR